MNNAKIFKFAVVIIVLGVFVTLALLWLRAKTPNIKPRISSYDECVAAGYPVMESYPQQCKTSDGRTFIQDIGNEFEKQNFIRADSPRPNQIVVSPLNITGQARGAWFFEATFPVKMLDANGKIVGQNSAQAQGEWMTEEYVPFIAILEFSGMVGERGTLVLEKDSPSGLPKNADELRIPIVFGQSQTIQEEAQVPELSRAIMKTNKGNITLKFYSKDAPKTVNNFIKLAKEGFYNKTKFHRVIKDFMIQGGDPLSKDENKKHLWGTGGPGYEFEDEINSHKLVRGSLAMANSGPDTNGSQFFIVTAESTPWLDGKHINFGYVTDGMDVVEKIGKIKTDERDRPQEDIIIESIELIK